MENTQSVIQAEGTFIFVKGNLDGTGADTVIGAMNKNAIFTLDFSEVESVNFAAMRALLRGRQNGIRFCIINAVDRVVEKFEDSGVSVFINVCRKPKPLNLGKYKEFGAGYLSKAFNSEDGDSMIKVYGAKVPKWIVAQEKTISRAVMVFGIPTPLVGTLYEDGDNTGLDFERIAGKHSFSRIISQEPQRMDEITRRFAAMCRKLHSTECDTALFSDRRLFYRDSVVKSKDFTDSEKSIILDFVDNIPAATTCLHGDMQMSNVITCGKDDLWIDLSDFGYGNPMLDMGMWYFLSNLAPEDRTQSIFHLNKKQMAEIWNLFMVYYFDADTEEKKAEIVARVEPYAALHMLYLGTTYGYEDGMKEYIRMKLIR